MGDHIYSSAPTLNINANISGGTDKLHYYLSAEYLNQEGIALNTGYQKAGFRSNIEAQVSKMFKIGNNANMTYRYTEGSGGTRFLMLSLMLQLFQPMTKTVLMGSLTPN